MCLQLFLIFTCDGQTDTLTATKTVLTVVTERFVCVSSSGSGLYLGLSLPCGPRDLDDRGAAKTDETLKRPGVDPGVSPATAHLVMTEGTNSESGPRPVRVQALPAPYSLSGTQLAPGGCGR